ncbi:MAG: TrkH family potassium uptake protein, partial [Actinomyces sp.]
MATVPQTDTADEPEPRRGSQGGSEDGSRAGGRRQAHWHAPFVSVIGHPWKGRRKRPAEDDRADEPPVRPPLPATEPTGLRRLLR